MVRSLLEASPEAARQHDSDHWTPLHHAIEQDASLPVLRELLSAWPEAARHPSVDGTLPLHVAVTSSAPLAVLAAPQQRA